MGEYFSKITFYDIVGYLLPGVTGVIALAMLCSMLNESWALGAPAGAGSWLLAVLGAYFVGHIMQGVAFRILPRSKLRDSIAQDGLALFTNHVDHVLELYNVAKGVNSKDSLKQLDSLKIDFEDREIFVARQGFYRGSSIGFGLIGMLLLVSSIFGLSVNILGYSMPRLMALFACFASAFASTVCCIRYRDFIRHEFDYAVAEVLKQKAVEQSEA